MTKTIIFDYDGTIHHTLGIYEPAFRETYQWLTEQKVTEEREIGSVEIAGWLGLNSKEMWNTFLPELDQSYKEQASRMVGDLMVRQIRKHKAVWYPGAEEMLTALKNRGYHLVILSNCKASYREAQDVYKRQVLRKLGRPSPHIDPSLEHILITGMFHTFFELIIHEMPLKDAENYVREMRAFYTAGWMKIMGQ